MAIKILAKRQAGVEDDFAFEERFKREAYAMAEAELTPTPGKEWLPGAVCSDNTLGPTTRE